MTKYELATELAKKMQETKPEIEIERTAKTLTRGMTTRELQKALNYMNK